MSKPLRVLYFAALGEALDCREEQVEAEGITTAGELRDWLAQRAPRWQALASSQIRMAVNQSVARAEQPVEPGDEIAFFPPVTGG